MAEKEMQSLSRLRNPRTESKPEPIKGADNAGENKGDESDGEGGAHGALEAMHGHEPSSKHAVVSHDGYGMTSHTVDENGEHTGPHDHANIEELKSHLGKFFNEEEGEGHEQGGSPEPMEDSGSLY